MHTFKGQASLKASSYLLLLYDHQFNAPKLNNLQIVTVK